MAGVQPEISGTWPPTRTTGVEPGGGCTTAVATVIVAVAEIAAFAAEVATTWKVPVLAGAE